MNKNNGKRNIINCVLFLSCLFFSSDGICESSKTDFGENSTLSDTEITKRIYILDKSTDWIEKEKFVLELSPYSNKESVFKSLVKELDRINRDTDTNNNLGEYYIEILSALSEADMSSNHRLQVVVDNVECGNAMGNILIEHSNMAIPLLIKRLDNLDKSQDEVIRGPIGIILLVLLDIYRKKEISIQEKEKFSNIFLYYLKDRNFLVREEAVNGLSEIGDTSVIESLSEVANNDPFKARIYDKETGRNVIGYKYPVREKAKYAIEKIKSREKNQGREEKKTK